MSHSFRVQELDWNEEEKALAAAATEDFRSRGCDPGEVCVTYFGGPMRIPGKFIIRGHRSISVFCKDCKKVLVHHWYRNNDIEDWGERSCEIYWL